MKRDSRHQTIPRSSQVLREGLKRPEVRDSELRYMSNPSLSSHAGGPDTERLATLATLNIRRFRTHNAALAVSAFLAAAGCGPAGENPYASVERAETGQIASPLVGGTELSAEEAQTGILPIDTYDGFSREGYCTATVLYSSTSTDRTWLVTAAHCFSDVGPLDPELMFVHGHFAQPRASARHRVIGADCYGMSSSGISTCWTDLRDSTVYVHPEWLANGGHTAWFGPRDMAFIRVDEAIPVYDDADNRIAEYRRPIFAGPPQLVSDPFRVPDATWRSVFCGQGNDDYELHCDGLNSVWFTQGFREQFIQLPRSAWTGGFYEAGDSGGPLIADGTKLSDRSSTGSDSDLAKHGIVLGVLQGPTFLCDYIKNDKCDPADGLATNFFGVDGFLAGVPNSDEIERVYTYASTSCVSTHDHGGDLFSGTYDVELGCDCLLGQKRTSYDVWNVGNGDCTPLGWASSDPLDCRVLVTVNRSGGYANGHCYAASYSEVHPALVLLPVF